MLYRLFTSSSHPIMAFTETISYTEARERLADVLSTVEATRDVIVITRRGHANVALIAEDELSSLQETAHLLRSPANARRLLESLARSMAGQGTEMTVDELATKSGILHAHR
jgi:antitoxin YefM